MNYFRKLITYKKLTALFILGMLLRSSIAVGYMLDTNPENGDLFSIMLCDGPAGINAISGLSDSGDSHAHHHGHHANDDATNNEHQHAASQDHPFSSCSFWSASSISLIEDSYSNNSNDNFLSDEKIIYEAHFNHYLRTNTRLARAPPTQS